MLVLPHLNTRLTAVAGDADVATVTAVDLANLVADHTRGTAPTRRHQAGRAAEATVLRQVARMGADPAAQRDRALPSSNDSSGF